MGKNRLVTITICLVFIVFSGIFYFKSGADGTKGNFVKNTGENPVMPGQSPFPGNVGVDGQQATGRDSTASPDRIAVYICGAVKHPGVYSFTKGRRLCDAVKKAGGFKKSAARTAVNLAQLLNDSEQIIIPTKKEAASGKNKTDKGTEGEASLNGNGRNGLVNINTASKEELMTLPGIGGSKADAVIEYRLSDRFNTIEDIKNVTGIKDGVFNQIKDKITV